MLIGDVIRAAIPGASEAVCEHVLWGRTPYSMGKVTARDIYKAASQWRRICDNGLNPCDLCHRIAPIGKYTCDVCQFHLDRINAKD